MLTTVFAFATIIILAEPASLVATEVIPAGKVITPDNTRAVEGTEGQAELLYGREVKRTVYSGQAVRLENTAAPRLVLRNQTVILRYVSGALEITVSGRALADASAGETVNVMNLGSRKLVRGIVQPDGSVLAS